MGRKLRVGLFLVVTTLAAYWPLTRCGFVSLDDDVYVTANPHVRAGLTMDGIRWAFTTTHGSLWHPLTWLSHMLDVQLYGMNPVGHHLTNLYLHIANSILVFLILRRLSGAFWRSVAVGVLFALHPLRVESVAWVAERKDVLSMFFALLTIRAYVGYARHPSLTRYGLVVLWCALGLLSKPMLVTLPFVLLLLDYWPLGRLVDDPGADAGRRESLARLVGEKVPLFVMAGGTSVVAFLVAARTGAVGRLDNLPLVARIANALVAYAKYITMTLWPRSLAVFYPLAHAWSVWELGGAALVLVGGCAAAIALRRRAPYAIVGWLWFVGALVPVIGLVQAGSQAMADRFSYFPLIGLFVVAAWTGHDVLRRWPLPRPVLVAGAAILVGALGCSTFNQVTYWQSSTELFDHALAVTQGNWLAHNNLGDVLLRKGNIEEATAHFRESLRIEPDDARARFNLGVALGVQHQTEAAIEQYEEAARLDPSDARTHNNLGLALLATGRIEEAVGELRQAVQLTPDAATHYNLGLALARGGRLDDAIEQYGESVRLRPDFAEAHYGLGMVLARAGRLDEASVQSTEAIRLKPELAAAAVGDAR
jgi:Flp pilus assembly protein TadD